MYVYSERIDMATVIAINKHTSPSEVEEKTRATEELAQKK